jgi:hypothetical protein
MTELPFDVPDGPLKPEKSRAITKAVADFRSCEDALRRTARERT